MHPNLRLENRRASLFTLFVDNLPESMASRKLHDLFNMFGVVKDVFIPQKRRKLTYTRFGFVRYDCSITADVAEQKANGLWVDDKSLSVKITEYGKGIEDRQRLKPLPTRHSKPRKASVKNELMKREVKNVLVREESGGDAIISFSSKEELLSKMTLLKSWFHDWCEYITEWRTVTSVMELISTSLNLECDGRVYPIGVFEEQITEEVSISCKGINSSATDKDVCSNINGVLPLPVETNLVNEDVDKVVDVASTSNMALKDLVSRMKVRAELAEEGSWSHASTVEETKDCAEILMKKTQVWWSPNGQRKACTRDSAIMMLRKVALGHDPFGLQLVGPASAGLKPSSVRLVCGTSRVGSQSKTSSVSAQQFQAPLLIV
ncbi:hypothetical protein ACSBR2_003418 [Camellia fascicularis]